MIRRPPRSTRTDTLFPYTTLVRSFLGAFLGGDSLATLRSVLLEAEAARPAARTHPRIDVRSAGDLLVRAGFALPVADTETLTVRSEERRVGKECVSTCRSRWSPSHSKKKQQQTYAIIKKIKKNTE